MANALTLLEAAAKAPTADLALEALVRAWQKTPAPELEDAIVALDGAPGDFTGNTDDFRAAAKKATAAERGPLLAALTKGTLADVQARLEVVASWSRDPRTSRVLVDLLSRVPWSSDSSKRAWTAAFALMEAQHDERFVRLATELPSKWKVRATMQKWLENAFARSVARITPITAALTTEEQRALARVVKAFARQAPKKPAPPRGEGDLLAAVYATPTDDAPRHVLADLLLEQNDPRGAFIAAQLAGDVKANKLLKAHAKEWLGALAPVLGADVVFRRGFPAEGRTKFRHQADAEKYGARPEWATFETLEWGTPTPIPAGQEAAVRFIGPAFKHLKHAVGPSLPSLLSSTSPWALESLEVSVTDSSELRRLGEALPTRFPRLTRLTCRAALSAWFAGIPNLERLQELALSARAMTYADGWEALQAISVPTLTLRVGVSQGESAWRFSRGADGRFSRLVVSLDGAEGPVPHEDHARHLPAGFLESFELVAAKNTPTRVIEAVRKALEAAQRRRPLAREKAPASPETVRPLSRALAVGTAATGARVVVDVNGAQVVSPVTRTVVGRFDANDLSCAALDDPGELLAVVTWKQVKLFTLPDFRERWTVPSEIFEARRLQFTADGLWHFARTGSERLDLKTGRQLERVGAAAQLLEVSRDGRWWLTYGKTTRFTVGAAGAKKRHMLDGVSAALLPDGQVLIVDKGLTISRVDPATGAVVKQAKAGAKGMPEALRVSQSGRRAVFRAEGGFVVVDTETLETTAHAMANAQLAALSPDDQTLLAAGLRFTELAL